MYTGVIAEEIPLQILIPGFEVRFLNIEDVTRLQALYDKCADFALLVEGKPYSPGAAQEEFNSLPPGKTPADKLMIGVWHPVGQLVAVLDAVRDYPDAATWWIGLLMLAPEVRGKGLGRQIVQGFHAYAQAHRCNSIMLGVVEENAYAYRFWQKMGYELVNKTEPQQFGQKLQAVFVLRQSFI